MANYMLGVAPGFEVDLAYNATNNHVTGLRVNNTTGGDVYAAAKLPDGRVFGQVFHPGDTTLNIPNNVLTLTRNADGGFDLNCDVEARIPA